MDGWTTPGHLAVHISEVHRQFSKASLWAIVSWMEGVAGTRSYCVFPVGTVVCQTEAQLVRCHRDAADTQWLDVRRAGNLTDRTLDAADIFLFYNGEFRLSGGKQGNQLIES